MTFLDRIHQRPRGLLMLVLLLLFLAGLAFSRTGMQSLPDISVPRVLVQTRMPGLPASEIRTLLSVPMEDALAAVRGLTSMQSISRDGEALLLLDFDWGLDAEAMLARVRERADSMWQYLPSASERPLVVLARPERGMHLLIQVDDKDGDLSKALEFAEFELSPQLKKIKGLAELVIWGGREREVHIELELARTKVRGINAAGLARSLGAELADIPLGMMREGHEELPALIQGRLDSIAALAKVELSGPGGSFRLGDLGSIEYGHKAAESAFFTSHGAAVAVALYLQPGAEPLGTLAQVRRVLGGLETTSGTTCTTKVLYDSSISLQSDLSSTLAAGLAGMLSVIVAIFIFIGRADKSLLALLAIPVSLAFGLIVLWVCGISLNSMSLAGLAISIGLVSDNAVVVQAALAQGRKVHSVLWGSFGSTLTGVLVFIPIFLLPGALRALYGDLAIAVLGPSIMSWIYATFMMPALYGKIEPGKARFSKLSASYGTILQNLRQRKLLVVSIIIVTTLGGLALFLSLPLRYLPLDAKKELRLRLDFPSSFTIETLPNEINPFFEKMVELEGFASGWGFAGAGLDDLETRSKLRWEPNQVQLTIILKPKANLEDFRQRLDYAVREHFLSAISYDLESAGDPLLDILGLEQNSVWVLASSPEEVRYNAKAIQEDLESTHNLTVRIMPEEASEVLRAIPIRERQAALGASITSLAETLLLASDGMKIASMYDKGRLRDIILYQKPHNQSLSGLPVPNAQGALIDSVSLVRFQNVYEAGVFLRYNRQDSLRLQNEDIERHASLLTALEDTKGIENAASSVFEKESASIALVIVLVLVLLYLYLGAQLESFLQPLVVMTTIPFAITGLALAVFWHTGILDSGSIMALVVLSGLVVNNAILFHEARAERSREVTNNDDASILGAVDRLLPVLATSASTAFALLPLCFSSLAIQRSMAFAMLGGLLLSLILSVLVIPLLLSWTARQGRRVDAF